MIAPTQLKSQVIGKILRNFANYYGERYGPVRIQLNDMVAKGRISMESMYFLMLRNMAVTVAFSAKERMIIQMRS